MRPTADPIRHALDLIERHLPLDGKQAIDVGCGAGVLSRALATRGALVLGLEIDAARVKAAEAAGTSAQLRFAVGRAEQIPAPTGSADLIVLMHSFHHVPEAVRVDALREARRVLKADGRLHFFEPLPEGTMTEVLATVDDERETRRVAQRLLDSLGEHGFTPVERSEFETERRFAGVEAFIDGAIRVDPWRAQRVGPAKAALDERFAALAQRDPADGRYVLRQPIASFHFVRHGE